MSGVRGSFIQILKGSACSIVANISGWELIETPVNWFLGEGVQPVITIFFEFDSLIDNEVVVVDHWWLE